MSSPAHRAFFACETTCCKRATTARIRSRKDKRRQRALKWKKPSMNCFDKSRTRPDGEVAWLSKSVNRSGVPRPLRSCQSPGCLSSRLPLDPRLPVRVTIPTSTTSLVVKSLNVTIDSIYLRVGGGLFVNDSISSDRVLYDTDVTGLLLKLM